MAAKPTTFDQYIASVGEGKRESRQRLREIVRASAPDPVECMSYGVPTFKRDGRSLVGFGAGKDHCSFHPMSSNIVARLKRELTSYRTSPCTIRFRPEAPLPPDLVRTIVEMRRDETGRR